MLRVSLFYLGLAGAGLLSSGCDGGAHEADPKPVGTVDAGVVPDVTDAAPDAAPSPVSESGAGPADGGAFGDPDTGTGGEASAVGGASGISEDEPASAGAAGAAGDPYALPETLPTLMLEVAEADVATLEASPFDAADIAGAFTDESGVRYEGIDVNYRGAYALQTLILDELPQRNWKLKFSKEQKYRDRREWNLNFEQHLRQKLAYDLMNFAGVRAAEARHVLLVVNGVMQGLYLEYEDPDSKDWLEDKFGDDTGDLFKAARDIPDEPPYFATLEFLGETDEDYFLHYDKKTNDEPPLDTDYSSLREFLRRLNTVPDDEFPAWLEASFDVGGFISYLVVGNFAANWDSQPQRPKNFWLYQSPSANRWTFVPWDLDATFQLKWRYFNMKGPEASVFYQLDQFEDYTGRLEEEGTERPLVRRMMAHEEYRTRYLQRYREALNDFLDRDFLLGRVDALEALVQASAPEADVAELLEADEDMRAFIEERYATVTDELATLP